MCRLFGISAGARPVGATFWLLDAPDSLEVESRRNIDGSGLGYFDSQGTPILDKQPEPAYRDPEFIRAAIEVKSPTFVGHVRNATTGVPSVQNTQPFEMNGRLMAHNGTIGELDRLEEQLGDYNRLVLGQTDSERYFALITQQIDSHDGHVGAGLASAATWIAARLPLSSLNAVVATKDELWALRYPGQHALHLIEHPGGAESTRETAHHGLDLRSTTSAIHLPSAHITPTVVVASETLDAESTWRMLDVGELIHVAPDLSVRSTIALPHPPDRLIPLTGTSSPFDG